MWGRRQTSDDRSGICVQAVELVPSVHSRHPAYHPRKKKQKNQFTKYNGSMVQAFCCSYTEFLPSHPFVFVFTLSLFLTILISFSHTPSSQGYGFIGFRH
jgi:hypothetical protein